MIEGVEDHCCRRRDDEVLEVVHLRLALEVTPVLRVEGLPGVGGVGWSEGKGPGFGTEGMHSKVSGVRFRV
jgi:hypothetical protein